MNKEMQAMDTKQLRQKILDLAIHGRLVPQDPSDEPAAVLLERIQEEKAQLAASGKMKKTKLAGSAVKEAPFEVPKGWTWCRLEDYVINVTDGDHQAPPKSEKGIPFLVISDITSGKIDFSKSRRVPIEYYDLLQDSRKAVKGDILFTVTGSYGIVVPIDTDMPFCFQRHIGLIKPLQRNQYLEYALQSQYVKAICDVKSTGTAQKTVSLELLRTLMLPLPPLPEQRRIVAEIERWFAWIDVIERGRESLQATVAQAKRKILDLAIHGKLVKQDPSDEPAALLLERIQEEKAQLAASGKMKKTKMAGSAVKEVPFEVPKGWCMARMDNLCSLTDGKRIVGKTMPNLDVKYLRGERDAKDLDAGKLTISGALMILVDGENSGEIFRAPHDGYQGSTFKQSRIDKGVFEDYLLLVINSHRKALRENKVGSAIPHLNKKLFREIQVPLPPLPEQRRIVAEIERWFALLNTISQSV